MRQRRRPWALGWTVFLLKNDSLNWLQVRTGSWAAEVCLAARKRTHRPSEGAGGEVQPHGPTPSSRGPGSPFSGVPGRLQLLPEIATKFCLVKCESLRGTGTGQEASVTAALRQQSALVTPWPRAAGSPVRPHVPTRAPPLTGKKRH